MSSTTPPPPPTPRPSDGAGGSPATGTATRAAGTAAAGPAVTPAPATPAVRAQILATEHWSLLATRSTTWSEVMSRISIHLTVSSAALVVLALVGQATDFGGPFRVLSIGLTSVVLLLGTLTGMRVMNASHDDAALIVGMNRLRAAYTELDPGVARYLVTSVHDDQAGVMGTYTMGVRRSTLSHVLASTSLFMHVVNAIVAGTLGALVADAAGAPVAVVAVVGVVTGLGFLATVAMAAQRSFSDGPGDVQFPSDSGGP